MFEIDLLIWTGTRMKTIITVIMLYLLSIVKGSHLKLIRDWIRKLTWNIFTTNVLE